jgi:hypothetical protein
MDFPDFDEVAWAGPTPLLEQALSLVQTDLDAAGLASLCLSFAQAGSYDDGPIVNVQWRGTWTSDSIEIGETDLNAAVVDVASHVTQGLVELEGIYWPTCPLHGVRAKPVIDHRRRAIWNCNKRGVTPHQVAPIGKLPELPKKTRNKGPLWRSLADLASP